MTVSAEAWIRLSEAAYATACREAEPQEPANPAAVCHAAHRCAVGLLRARLVEAEIPHPDVAHPVVLLECCLDLDSTWECLRDPLRVLHVNVLDTEHPEHALDLERARTSLEACELVREKLASTRTA